MYILYVYMNYILYVNCTYIYIYIYKENSISVTLHLIQCNNNNNNNDSNSNTNNNSFSFRFCIFNVGISLVLFVYSGGECQPMHVYLISLLKVQIRVQFERSNLVFWSWR